MPRMPVYYCTTNSGHQHSTEWEAENCSTLHAALRAALEDCRTHQAVDYDALYDDVHAAEKR